VRDWPIVRGLRRHFRLARRSIDADRQRRLRVLRVAREESGTLAPDRGTGLVALQSPAGRGHRCHGCGYCEVLCPAEALRLETPDRGAAIEGSLEVAAAPRRFELDPLRCVGCGLCLEICPASALEASEAYGPVFDRRGLRSTLIDASSAEGSR
jgi:NADH-quinone oxidoreductase subunit I